MLLSTTTPDYINQYSSLENAADAATDPPEVYLHTYGHLESKGNFSYRQFNESIGLHWIYRGTCTFSFPQRTVCAEKNDLVVLFPGQQVHYYDSGNAPLAYHWIILKGTRIADALASAGLTPDSPMLHIRSRRWKLTVEDIRQSCQLDFMDLSTASALAWLLLREIHGNLTERTPVSIAKRTRYIIDQLYSTPLSIISIAEQLRISRVSLYRHFQREYGMSPKQYLQTKRLDLAQRLIQQPDLTVKEITSMCGFNSEAYFSRLFHQVFGTSPSAYRLVNSEREHPYSRS